MANQSHDFMEKEVVLTIRVPRDFDREDERMLDDEFAAILEKQGWELASSKEYRDVPEQALTPVNRVTITRERYSEDERWSDNFWVDASKTPSVELFKEAVETFLKTPEGAAAIESTCNDFNWGDAMIYVPTEVWNAHGIYPFDFNLTPHELGLSPTSSDNIYSFSVDQDEILIPDYDLPITNPAKNLPEGWQWQKYQDGSGSLQAPDGTSHFHYDLVPYSSQDGIEYKANNEAEWSVFWGTLNQFMTHAEKCVGQKFHRSFLSLGEHHIPSIMQELANNAWYGRDPQVACISAGKHMIEIQGYTYEPTYECFSSTASLSLDGTILFGMNSHNVAPYRNEVFQTGTFETLEEAISHIKENVKELDYVLDSKKHPPIDDVIKNAETRSTRQTPSARLDAPHQEHFN